MQAASFEGRREALKVAGRARKGSGSFRRAPVHVFSLDLLEVGPQRAAYSAAEPKAASSIAARALVGSGESKGIEAARVGGFPSASEARNRVLQKKFLRVEAVSAPAKARRNLPTHPGASICVRGLKLWTNPLTSRSARGSGGHVRFDQQRT
jgi:hypothetical protein